MISLIMHESVCFVWEISFNMTRGDEDIETRSSLPR